MKQDGIDLTSASTIVYGSPPPRRAFRRSYCHIAATDALVCTENLNPGIVVMESAEDGERFDASGPLNRARNRRILVQRPMRSDGVVVIGIGFQNPTQLCLAKTNNVVQALAPDRSDQPFGKAILPR